MVTKIPLDGKAGLYGLLQLGDALRASDVESFLDTIKQSQ